MKTFKLLLLAFVAVLGTSCGGDDDGPGFELNSANLAGSYNITYLNVIDTEQVPVGGTNVTSETTLVGDTFTNAVYTFNDNGTYTVTGSYRITETTKVNGSVVDTDTYIEMLDDTGAFTLNSTANTITFGSGIDADVVNISGFSANGLTLKQNDVDGADRFQAEIRLVKR